MKKSILLILIIVIANLKGFSQSQQDSIILNKYNHKPFTHDGKKVGYNKILEIIGSNPTACQEMIFAKTQKEFSNICVITGLTLIVWPMITEITDGNANWTLVAIGLPIFAMSVPLNHSSNSHSRNAIKIYNQGVYKSRPLSNTDMKIGLFSSGVGLQLTF